MGRDSAPRLRTGSMNPLQIHSRASLRAVLPAILAAAFIAAAPVIAGSVGGEIVARVDQQDPPTAKGVVPLPDASTITKLRYPTGDTTGGMGFTGLITFGLGVPRGALHWCPENSTAEPGEGQWEPSVGGTN